ncbi:MAG TPA: histidine kinase [Cyanobacteria bacterium UBA11162]|nr:histidine kinase [Cyanobacteria bacterium UBA11162]
MSRRSLKVSPKHITRVKLAASRRFARQIDLAERARLCRATITNFLNGKAIDRLNFIEICEILELDWEDIADIKKCKCLPLDEEQTREHSDINILVQTVRQKCSDKIISLYGKIQLLDIYQPIDVNTFYVEFNILEQLSSQQQVELSDVLKDFNPATDYFDDLNLGRVRQQRLLGLKAVEKYPRLMILGKPGSGKTTFLQHLAIQCNEGRFRTDLVPIFLSLKNFAKYARDERNFKLLNYISRQFQNCDIASDQTEVILSYGRGLILLDGLDEVPNEDESEVVEQIRQFSEDYYQNQFIITCRIAAQKYRFPGFTDVEVADFDQHQIKSFAQKWFVAVAKNNQDYGRALASQFIEKLNRKENRQIRELAVTPILLHLTCLVFQTKAEFPSNRAKLYEQGLDILLKRWDEARGIKRDEVYRNLTLPRKKQLLAQIAAITFERGDYFFEQDKIQQLIADYLSTLFKTSRDALEDSILPSQLDLDSEAVLKAIEAQHGLLVERARGIYSFSHLTFQEYFTARHIIDSLETNAWKQLGCQIVEKRWREVLLLALGMCQNADFLLQVMKQQVDALVATDHNVQQFLVWLSQLPLSVNICYKPAAVRAFYFALDLALDSRLDNNLEIALDLALDRGFDYPALVPAFDITLDITVVPALDTALDMAFNIALDTALIPALDIALDMALVRALNPGRDLALNIALVRALNRAIVRALDPKLRQALQELKDQLPTSDTNTNEEKFKQWWQANGHDWTEKLRRVMIEHRNIGHYWQFSKEQREILKQYYDANKLLVDCLNSGCNVTPLVRKEIEDTLFLPIAQIENKVDATKNN